MAAAEYLVPQTLASFEVFQGLALPALRDVHKAARVRRISTQTRVFNQGDPDVRAHALVEGIVRISQWGSDGAQTVILYAALIALGSDLTAADMARMTLNIEEGAIGDMMRRIEAGGRLPAANRLVLDYFRTLPVTKLWLLSAVEIFTLRTIPRSSTTRRRGFQRV